MCQLRGQDPLVRDRCSPGDRVHGGHNAGKRLAERVRRRAGRGASAMLLDTAQACCVFAGATSSRPTSSRSAMTAENGPPSMTDMLTG